MGWRVLVTGSEGFVGRHLCRALESAGHDVMGCSRSVAPGQPNRFVCDLTDTLATMDLFDRIPPPTHIVHLAAMTFLPDADKDPDRVIDANVSSTTNLLATVAANEIEPRILFVSSCQAYGPPNTLPITEKHPLHPEHVYGISKRMAEDTCRTMVKSEGLDIVIARPFNHTGPGHRPEFSLAGFARQIARIEAELEAPVLHVGNLESRRDYLDVRDVVEAYIRLLEDGEAGEAYNVCRGVSESMQAMLDQLLKQVRAPIAVETDPARMRASDIPDLYGSFEKLRALTGWEPEVPVEDMLRTLLDYWREQSKQS